MILCKNSSNIRRSSQGGFGTLSFLGIIAALTITLLMNIEVLQQKSRQLGRISGMISQYSNSLQLQTMFSNAPNPVILNTLNQSTLSSGTAVNQTAQTKGVRCIFSARGITGTFTCVHKKIPDPMTGPCAAQSSEDAQKICWILTNLNDHKVEVIFPSDSSLNGADDLLIDNRSSGSGFTIQNSKCDHFNSSDPLLSKYCPHRVEIFAWVECDGAAPLCGHAVPGPIGGQIRMAAILIGADSATPIGLQKYSVIDIDGGAL